MLPRSVGYVISLFIVLAVCAVILFPRVAQASITKSTVERTPISATAATDIGYYFEDQAGWISSTTRLNKALKYFQSKTGVAPVLIISEYNYTNEELAGYASTYYDEHIEDEAHLVFVFNEYNSAYRMEYVVGAGAKTVLDTEAMDILMDYIEEYYYSDKSEDEMFAQAFEKAADRMMKVTKSPVVVLVVLTLVLATAIVVLLIVKTKAKRDKEKAAETERILNADIKDLE